MMSTPHIFSYITLIGTVSISDDGEGRITGIYLPNSNLPAMEDRETDTIADAAGQIGEYMSGKRRTFELELSYGGTGFRTAVMDSLREIPYGEVRTYREVAEAAGSPNAFRAVGTVCSSNPLPIVIPCHRVVPSSGGLGCYSGGTSLKRRLLDHERTMG